MDNCCGGEQRDHSIKEMLRSLIDSKVINVQLLTIAIGVLFIVVMFKNKYKIIAGR
ncbi:uncharacterized protein LOC129912010 [Episyrphus balteatus]|uniref:uncharacterized protein LOC129912010 n=1 Tax=Episyrphus balteatus TaxID=286459 RepID=UPI00248592E3|nr:uncharacterized protein LOC129912010 [Episyrphus balteatus]